jgi:thiamine pyrophosphokinase
VIFIMANHRAVIFANGILPDLKSAQSLLKEGDFWIAADGGSRHALACGRAPDVLIGDLDSLPDSARESLRRAGTKVRTHPSEKDETDLELAVWFALREGFSSILIVGGLGGRTDQIVANLSLLADPALREYDIRIDDGREEALCVRESAVLLGATGDVVSLIPFGLAAEGVVTEGLQYPLREETLLPSRTRGVSNRMTESKAEISLERGVLLCIHTRSIAE